MAPITKVKQSNTESLPAFIPDEMVAVFIGATSGIGEATLKQFVIAAKGKSPRVYVVGRSALKSAPLLEELQRTDPAARIEFIEKDGSLLQDIEAATSLIRKSETKVDLLFISIGFISFEGRIETSEGLEPSMTTRFYSRALAIQQLLPLLSNSENPHVSNVLAGGMESSIDLDDLDLAKPGNYSIVKAAVHSATMLTLMLEKWAQENPKISFVHSHPGIVRTPILSRASRGISGILLRNFVSPLVNTFFATSADDSGARSIFQATNARYTVDANRSLSPPIPEGLSKATMTPGGVFLVNQNSEITDNEKVLKELRISSASLVASHFENIVARTL
ncbi:unnamed protein product [Clonostachys byssicola]|uniref:Uncharacterized protein n=1 Tax=Clonostachys byssicola TaxID=160290 RepID=A0A9N9Y7I4_9HYPO|nr:unnamed protein product [Clonostachys byssicola]